VSAVRRCHAGYTRDPWPCCGKEVVPGQRRKSDGLCGECGSLVADGRRLRAMQARGDAVEFLWWSRDYAAVRFVGHRALESAFYDLVEAVVDVDRNARPAWGEHGLAPLVDNGRAPHEFADFRCVARTTPTVRTALVALHAHVSDAIEAAGAEGLRRGSSLLQALAEGAITVGDFERKAGR